MTIIPVVFASRTISPSTTETPFTHSGAPAASVTFAPANAPLEEVS